MLGPTAYGDARMNRWTFALFLAVLVGLACAPSASAQGLPGCPDDDEVLVSTVPDFVRVGASLAFTVERVNEGVSEFDVAYPSATGEQREHFVFAPDQDEIRVIRAALTTPGTFDLTVTWQQNAGQPDACAGTDRYEAIPVVKRTARVGRPGTARLSGRYRANYTRGKPARWNLRPSCDVFGCVTALRSSGGFRGTLRPQPDGTYFYDERTKIATCHIRYGDGSTRTYGIYA